MAWASSTMPLLPAPDAVVNFEDMGRLAPSFE